MSISITNYKLLPIRRDKQIISSSGVSSGGGASSGGGGISATWGSIIGTLSLQTDLQGVLDNKLFTADLLSTILTIDGTGSGIDADKLDGQHGNYFAPIANPTFTGTILLTYSTGGHIGLKRSDGSDVGTFGINADDAGLMIRMGGGGSYINFATNSTATAVRILDNGNVGIGLSPNVKFNVYESTALGSTVGNYQPITRFDNYVTSNYLSKAEATYRIRAQVAGLHQIPKCLLIRNLDLKLSTLFILA